MNPHQPLFDRQDAYFWDKLKNSTASMRIAKLRKMKKWMFAHQEALQKALYEDFRKPAHEADLMEFLPVMAEIKDAIANLHDWMRPKRVSTPLALIGTSTEVTYEPKGRTLILAPWNFPFMLTVGPLVSAIAAGCTVIVKPSEYSDKTTKLIGKMIKELFKEEEVAMLEGDHTLAAELTALPFDHIFFTGSPEIGRKVMRAAADNLASVTLELGGRNAVIVDASARIKDAAKKLVWGKFVNAGQSCMSPNFIMVHASIYDKFVNAIKEAYQNAYGSAANNMEESKDFCHIVNPRHQARLQSMLDASIEAGGKVLIGGKGNNEKSYLDPTILVDIEAGNPILDQELFGPIMPIMKYESLDSALAFIRKNEKPLAMYVFAKKQKVINKVQNGTSSGSFMVNETTIAFGHTGIPFGGVNESGIGKAHGHAGFLAFTNEKPVMRQNTVLPSSMLAHAPYVGWKRKALNLVIRWFS